MVQNIAPPDTVKDVTINSTTLQILMLITMWVLLLILYEHVKGSEVAPGVGNGRYAQF